MGEGDDRRGSESILLGLFFHLWNAPFQDTLVVNIVSSDVPVCPIKDSLVELTEAISQTPSAFRDQSGVKFLPFSTFSLPPSAAVAMAESHGDFVVGIVCQRRLFNQPYILHMTPGTLSPSVSVKYSFSTYICIRLAMNVILIRLILYERLKSLEHCTYSFAGSLHWGGFRLGRQHVRLLCHSFCKQLTIILPGQCPVLELPLVLCTFVCLPDCLPACLDSDTTINTLQV